MGQGILQGFPLHPARLQRAGQAPLEAHERGREARKGVVVKAIRLHARGGPEQLVYEDAPRPHPAAGEALLRVYAAGITPTELTWSETYRTPDGHGRLPTIPGHDVSGVVEALGPGVSEVSPGEAVYGLIGQVSPDPDQLKGDT